MKENIRNVLEWIHAKGLRVFLAGCVGGIKMKGLQPYMLAKLYLQKTLMLITMYSFI